MGGNGTKRRHGKKKQKKIQGFHIVATGIVQSLDLNLCKEVGSHPFVF